MEEEEEKEEIGKEGEEKKTNFWAGVMLHNAAGDAREGANGGAEEARGSAASGLVQADKAATRSSIPVDEAPAEIPGPSSGGAAAIYQGHEGHLYPRHSLIQSISNFQLPEGDAGVRAAKVFAQNDSEKHSLDSAIKCAEAPTGTQNEAQQKTVEYANRFYL
jgi:hypothetical protein